ncbi:YciI family protein [Actinomadura kijaniata]|uniref:YciI family protein n=1 Tax=Actinomadura kijaniata TaxID=46161 RepID=UPI0008323524|nr:YciI family protein [Actinomadura kijaniata]
MIVRYTGDAEDVEPHVAGHVEYLERHHAAGTFLVSGQTVPEELGGAIVAVGVSREEAERIAAADPFVVAGVAEYEIVTIEPGRCHPALEPLVKRV